jgi:DNA-binding FadR family transcriptional regulator
MAQVLGLNRTTLRESMAVLEALGFVSRKQGNGTHLRLPGVDFQRYYFETALRLNHITLRDLEETREMLELEIVQSAARNATDQDIKTLSYFLEKLLSTRDEAYGLELDITFHLHIGTCTHNPVIQALLESLSSALREVLRERRSLVGTTPNGMGRTDITHVAVLEAIRDHDPRRALKAMQVHFDKWRDYVSRAKEIRKNASSGSEKRVRRR